MCQPAARARDSDGDLIKRICIYKGIHIYACIFSVCIHTYVYTYICIHVYVCMYVCMYVFMYVCMYVLSIRGTGTPWARAAVFGSRLLGLLRVYRLSGDHGPVGYPK